MESLLQFEVPAGSSLEAFRSVKSRHQAIHVVVSPPRCSSTAFARVFWEHPSVRYYCHEPFEVTYYHHAGVDQVLDKLATPLDLQVLQPAVAKGSSLVIKEMPYQVGMRFPFLLELATPPVLFLIRDPRLNIASRIRRKQETGASPFFPLIETGWELIAQQIQYCQSNEIDYLIVDASDFRNHPEAIFSSIFSRVNLPFDPKMLVWQAYPDVELDNLGGEHSHLYRRVLTSTGIQPPTEPVPPIDFFPIEHGQRDHVLVAKTLYEQLLADPHRISVS